MKEIWRGLDKYPDYEISNLGRIKVNSRKVMDRYGKSRIARERLLSQSDSSGYLVVRILHKGKYYTKRVHRLVAISFISNPYNKPFVNHIDGNKKNNKVYNLEWVTPKENSDHAKFMSLTPVGERIHSAKLTAKDVIDIRTKYKDTKLVILADMYGVSIQAISDVKKRKSWSHLII